MLLLTKGLLKEVILRGTESKYAAAFMCPLSPVQEIRVFSFFPCYFPVYVLLLRGLQLCQDLKRSKSAMRVLCIIDCAGR